MTIFAERYHDISCGHRVVGHESKCRHLHGHNYRVHFICSSDDLDSVGRVIDFGVIKEKLCMWIEDNWDHKFLAWKEDPLMQGIINLLDSDENDGEPYLVPGKEDATFRESIVFVPFNPTAENMAQYLLGVIGPVQLMGTGVTLIQVTVGETAKCSATAIEGSNGQ